MQWLETGSQAGLRFAVSHDTGLEVGLMVARRWDDPGDQEIGVTGVRVILERSTAHRNGFRPLTCYPDLV